MPTGGALACERSWCGFRRVTAVAIKGDFTFPRAFAVSLSPRCSHSHRPSEEGKERITKEKGHVKEGKIIRCRMACVANGRGSGMCI